MEERYDFFLAHASDDEVAATLLFDAIGSERVKGFFSPRSNQMSEDWHARTPVAHGRSDATVILLSPATKHAAYQRDEIVRAVDLNRNGEHRIFVIYWNAAEPMSGVDYGLALFVHRVANDEAELVAVGREINLQLKEQKRESAESSPGLTPKVARRKARSDAHASQAEQLAAAAQRQEELLRQFDRSIGVMSDDFVRLHLASSDSASVDALREQLKGSLTAGGKQIEDDAIASVSRRLLEKSGSRATISFNAYAGSGREQVAALLYLELVARSTRKPRLIPVIFDWKLQNSDWRLPPEIRDMLTSSRRHPDKCQYVLLIVGSKREGGSSPATSDDLNRLLKYLQNNALRQLTTTWEGERPTTGQRAAADTSLAIIERETSHSEIARLIEIASLVDGFALEDRTRWTAQETLLAVCRRHRIAPDMFIARRVLASVRSGSGSHVSLATLIEGFVEDIVRARLEAHPSNEAEGASAQTVAALVRKYSRTQYLHFMRGIAPPPDSGYSELIRTHLSIRYWLIAHELFRSFAEFEDSDATRLFEFQANFDHVFPSQITAYFRDYLEHAESTAVETALKAVQRHLQVLAQGASAFAQHEDGVPGLNVRYRKFATTCIYLAGRVTSPAMQQDMKDLLPQLSELAEADLQDFRRVRPMLFAGKHVNSGVIRDWWKGLFELLGEKAASANGDIQTILTRLEREILLLQRGIFISQAMLRDEEAAEAYIAKLMSSYADDDLNRGFHREYYGDIPFKTFKPLLSDDASLGPCRKTLAALMSELPTQEANAPMAQIQLYTVASLVRPRNLDSSRDFDEVARFLGKEVARHGRFNGPFKAFIETTIAEIEYGQYALEAYVDDLYEVKLQARTGWRSLHPPESVAAHQYMVERLADLFVQSTISNRDLDKQRVLELVRMHDIGEAITSDIPSPEKTRQDEINESDVVQRISLIGALTGSNEFLKLFEAFQVFEQVKKYRHDHSAAKAVLVANDLDRLDLLIQYHRYIRENGAIENQVGFKESVGVDRFFDKDMRKCAQRFTDYFQSDLSKRTPASPFATRLWPAAVPQLRRIGAARASGVVQDDSGEE